MTPHDTSFFDLFSAMGQVLLEGTVLLTEAIGSEPPRRAAIGLAMEDVEHRGDETGRELLRKLDTTFVTPFDREDVHELTSRLDDCLDLMQATVDLVVLVETGPLPPAVGEIVQVLSRQAELTAEAMPRLRSVTTLTDYCSEVGRLENQADQLHRRVLADLLAGGRDVFEAWRVKEVVDRLDGVADAFERVAHTVRTLAVKES
nr:DUF47 family protein [Kineococcus aurantiacus]